MTDKLTDVKAVLFDLDETLIDALTGLRAAHKAIIEKLRDYYPKEFSNQNLKSLQRRLLDFDDRMNLKTQYDRDEWWPKLLKELGLNQGLESSQIKELTQTYWDAYIRTAKPYENTKSVLKNLRREGLMLAVVTDTDSSGIPKRNRVGRLEFSTLLDEIIIGGEDTKETKPSSEPFKLAAKRLGLKPSECVMVGDKPFTDVRGAKAAGMKTILLKRREWGSEENPDITIGSLEELQDLL